jgi:glycosyltransferase involved in cell wall biosynthesis
LGNALIDAGHQVDLLGLADSAVAEETNDFKGRLYRRIAFRRTGWQEHRFGTFLPYRRHHVGHRIAASIKSVGVEHYDVIHYHGHVVETGLFMPPDVNYVHTLHDQGSECLRFVRFVGGERCTVTDPAGCIQCANASPNVLQTWLTKQAVMCHREAADSVFRQHKAVFVSEFLRQRFIANTRSNGRINGRVIHNFIAQPPFVPDARPASERPRILLSGRIDVYKGFVDLLDVVNDAALSRFEWRLAGDGPLMPRLRERHGHRQIQFLGFLSQEQLMPETAAASLVLVPSVCDEACATSILEALGFGVQVWALRRGGSPELMQYQSYEGQMRVFDTLAEMSDALHDYQPATGACTINPAVTVQARLPALLEYYGQ